MNQPTTIAQKLQQLCGICRHEFRYHDAITGECDAWLCPCDMFLPPDETAAVEAIDRATGALLGAVKAQETMAAAIYADGTYERELHERIRGILDFVGIGYAVPGLACPAGQGCDRPGPYWIVRAHGPRELVRIYGEDGTVHAEQRETFWRHVD